MTVLEEALKPRLLCDIMISHQEEERAGKKRVGRDFEHSGVELRSVDAFLLPSSLPLSHRTGRDQKPSAHVLPLHVSCSYTAKEHSDSCRVPLAQASGP